MADTAQAVTQKAPLPRAVRRAIRAAEKTHQQVYNPEKSEQPDGATTDAQGAEQSPDQRPDQSPEVLPVPQNEYSQDAVQGAAPAPEPKPPEPEAQSEPPKDEQPSAAPEAPAVDWEHKFRTLEGMLRSKDREIQGMQATLAAVANVQPSDPSSSSSGEVEHSSSQDTPQRPAKRHLKPEDVESYGEDFIRVMQNAARDVAANEISPELEKLRAENAALKQQLGGVSQRTARTEVERTEAFLNQQVPNWKQVNEDPEFLRWLSETDMFTGMPRQRLLDEAGKSNDGPRIAAFFTGYLNQTQALRGHQEAAPAAQPQASPQPVQQGTPTVDKTSLVAPGRPSTSSGTGAGAATDTEEPQFFTDKQVAAFYKDVTRGKYKRNPKDKDRMEKAIYKAAAAGRIRPAQGQRPML